VNIIIANFGNDSVALMQWAIEQQLPDVIVVSVDTGWAAPEWVDRVAMCQQWAAVHGLSCQHLTSLQSFADMVTMKGEFPTRQFQWCASSLKGLTILNWLDDEVDRHGRATILLPHSPALSLAHSQLDEFVDDSEYYGGRTVWYPLYQHTVTERDVLLERAGFELLTYRSLECDPCVNTDQKDLLRLGDSVLQRTAALEREVSGHMVDPEWYQPDETMVDLVQRLKHSKALVTMGFYDMGCGDAYGCGL